VDEIVKWLCKGQKSSVLYIGMGKWFLSSSIFPYHLESLELGCAVLTVPHLFILPASSNPHFKVMFVCLIIAA
jgi:hypothetical protein